MEGLIGRGLLRLFDEFGNALRLLLLIVVVKRLAVFLYQAPDYVAIGVELLILLGLGLLYLAVCVDVLGGLQGTVGVVFAHLFELLLVVLHLADELANLGQGRGGLSMLPR